MHKCFQIFGGYIMNIGVYHSFEKMKLQLCFFFLKKPFLVTKPDDVHLSCNTFIHCDLFDWGVL